LRQVKRNNNKEDPGQLKALVVAVVVIRVTAVLVVWLLLFVAMFLGYFTVPIFAVGAIIILFALPDVGLYARASSLERAQQERRSFLSASKESADVIEQPTDEHEQDA
jgi:membrane protein YdbS with pleckstrin-like domain